MSEEDNFLNAFKFEIELTHNNHLICSGGFQQCEGLEITMKPHAHFEGGNNGFVWQLPGRMEYGTLTFHRGMLHGSSGGVRPELWHWLVAVGSLDRNFRAGLMYCDGSVRVLSPRGSATWRFKRALPTRIKGPSLNAKSGDIAIEELSIAPGRLWLESVDEADGSPKYAEPPEKSRACFFPLEADGKDDGKIGTKDGKTDSLVEAQFNPDSLTVSYGKHAEKPSSASGNRAPGPGVSTFSIKLLFDSTEDLDAKTKDFKNVQDRYKKLKDCLLVPGEDPNDDKKVKKVLFVWSTVRIPGSINSIDETFTLFAPDGTPLRAEVNITMTGDILQVQTDPAAKKGADKLNPTPASTKPTSAPPPAASSSDKARAKDVPVKNTTTLAATERNTAAQGQGAS